MKNEICTSFSTSELKVTGHLSTFDAKLENSQKKIKKISETRLALGITISKLCIAAGIESKTYRRIISGQVTPRPITLQKLSKALTRLARVDPLPADKALRTAYNSALTLLAGHEGLDPIALINMKTSGGKCAASTIRQRAIYMVVVALDVPLSRVARAAGVSKQAASKALRKIEDARDDPEFDKILHGFEIIMVGVAQ